jgi:hypothetical protein
MSDRNTTIPAPPRAVRLRDRLAAHWRAGSLDGKLARGIAPDSDAALALRAHMLTEPAARAELAGQVQRVVDNARAGRPRQLGRIPTHDEAVLTAADEFDLVAERLRASGPVSARGVAQVRRLLTDGSGPLYFANATDALRSVVSRALNLLDERPAFG